MKKYRIIIDNTTSHAYVNDLKCDWGNENNGIIPFDSLDDLFAFANKHNIVLQNKNETLLKAEAIYRERLEKLEYYFFNKGISINKMWSAKNKSLVDRIRQLEELAFATREDIAAMPICIGSYDKLLKRLEDKVFGVTSYTYSSSCSPWTVSGSINVGNVSSYTVSSPPPLYKPKLKVGDSFLGYNGCYKISTIAMCYCAKTNQLVLAYCCGHGKSFNCELLDKYLFMGGKMENILL